MTKLFHSCEKCARVIEWLEIMKDEPDGYIKMSEVYHGIRRMIEEE